MSEPESPNPYEAPLTTDGSPLQPEQLYEGRLQSTALGLKLIYGGILLLLVSLIIGMVPWSLIGPGFLFIERILALGASLAILVVCIGPLFCLTVPPQTGLRPLVFLVVASQATTFASVVGVIAVGQRGGFQFLLVSTMFLVTAALFLGFLYRLGDTIRRPDLMRRARNVFIFAGVMLAVFVPVPLLVDFSSGGNFALIYVFAAGLLVIILFVAYANLVNALSDAIRHPGKTRTPIGIL